MSRSNPTAENPHPCQLWLEWKGGEGHLSFWDKNRGENGERVAIDVSKKPFRCIVLDRTATVRGYSKPRKSGLYANEVRDTRGEALTVRFFDGKEIIASGLWANIKDTVTSKRNGGGFAVNLYMAYKEGNDLRIGAFQIGGCALGPWFEFEKKNRKAILEKGLVIGRGNPEESGGVDFVPPTFGICEVSPETDLQAKKLDVELQAFLTEYFSRAAVPVAHASTPTPTMPHLPAGEAPHPAAAEPTPDAYDAQPEAPPEPDEEEIPF